MFKDSREKAYEEELQLELQKVEEDIKWWDLKLHGQDYMAPQNKLDLLKKKWAILTGLKNKIY